MKPRFFECECCGCFHPEEPEGPIVDCRWADDTYTYDQLDAKYGRDGWEEIYPEEERE